MFSANRLSRRLSDLAEKWTSPRPGRERIRPVAQTLPVRDDPTDIWRPPVDPF